MARPILSLKKKKRKSERELNTPLYVLRCVQAGLRLSDLDDLDYGFVLDILTEIENDSYKYKDVASQSDFDRF